MNLMTAITEATTVANPTAASDPLEDEAVRRILGILDELQTRVVAEIASHPDIPGSQLPALKARIEQLMYQYQASLTTAVHDAQAQQYHAATDAAEQATQTAGLSSGIVSISDAVLRVAQAHSASEIRGVTEQQLRAINRELSQAVLGGRTWPELLKNIGTNLNGPSVFGTMRTRVETIVRTESANIFNWTFQGRGNQLATQLPGLRKVWVHRHGMGTAILPGAKGHKGVYTPRPAHLDLDGRSIPWEQEFMVNGWPAAGPHDPKLPAGEVVNCGCRLVMDFSQVEDPLYRVSSLGSTE